METCGNHEQMEPLPNQQAQETVEQTYNISAVVVYHVIIVAS